MAPLKPFVQVVKVEGAEDAIKALRNMGVEVEVLGEKTGDTGEQGKRADTDFSSLIGTFGIGPQAIASMVGSLVGAGGLLSALQENSAAAKQLKADLEGVLDAITPTLALTGDPRFIEATNKIAVASGRDLKEVRDAIFPIVSGTSGASVDEQIDILRQAGELSKTEPDTPLLSFANALIALRGSTGGKLDPQQLQNLAVSTADLAVTNFDQLGQTLPAVLGVAGPSGATVPEAAAIFAQLTAPLGAAQASTAGQNILTRLAAPSDTGRKVLSARGVPEGTAPFEALQILAASGQLSALEIRDLLGEGPAAAGLPALLEGIDKVDSDRALIASSLEADAPDLGVGKIDTLRRRLPGFEQLEQERRLRQQIEAKKREQDEVLQTSTLRAAYEKALVDQGFSPSAINTLLEGRLGGLLPGYDQLVSLGLTPGEAIELTAPIGFGQRPDDNGMMTQEGPPGPEALLRGRYLRDRRQAIEDVFRDAAPNTFPTDKAIDATMSAIEHTPPMADQPASQAGIAPTIINVVNNLFNTGYFNGEPGVVSPTLPEVGD